MNDQLISSWENQELTLTGYTKQIVWGWVLWVTVERFKFQIKFQSSQLVYGRKAANHMAAFACSEGVSKMALSWELAGSFSTDTSREPMSLYPSPVSTATKTESREAVWFLRGIWRILWSLRFLLHTELNICAYMHTHTHTCTYTVACHTCTCTHTYTYVYTSTHAYTHMHMCIFWLFTLFFANV